MKKLQVFLIYGFLSLCAFSQQALAFAGNGKVVQVDGASLSEIAQRSESGMASLYKFTSMVLAFVGFCMFASSILRLIKITKGEIPNGKPIHAILGMVFSALFISTGFWLFSLSSAIKKGFVK